MCLTRILQKIARVIGGVFGGDDRELSFFSVDVFDNIAVL
jgi:hypothetical protein